MKRFTIKPAARNAIFLGGMCAISYLAVYVARNMLSSASPQIEEAGAFSTQQLGTLSSIYFVVYAVGQLINGSIGDRIKAKYMISFGLILAGIGNALFSAFSSVPVAAYICYGLSGFFLSMIYGPLTKVVAENTEPIYATRCSVGYTFSSYIGTPIAGVIAVMVTWNVAFQVTAGVLVGMGVFSLLGFLLLEKKGIISYNRSTIKKPPKGGKIKTLIQRQIIKFTFISIITGIVRTAVVFWLPTYLVQRLHFAPDTATMLFTVCTFVISSTTFLAVFVYELLQRNMDLAIFIFFTCSAAFFAVVLLISQPVINIVCLILAILSCSAASSLMWVRYCPSLFDTGLVSTATGYLDFVSYMAASVCSSVFANAVAYIGWSGLVLVWLVLVCLGVVVALPRRKSQN